MEGSSSSSSKSAKPPHNNKRGAVKNESSRAERKRVQDRLAQRATRERTKSRIAFLEQRLKSLEAQDRQGEIVSLTRIIDDLRNENHRLRDALLKMRSTIDETITATSGNCSSTSPVFGGATLTTTAAAPTTHFLRRHDSMSTEAASEVVVELAAIGGNDNAHDYPSQQQQRCPPPPEDGEAGAPLVEEEEERFDTTSFEFSPDTLLQMFEAAVPVNNLNNNNTSSSSSTWGPTSSSSLFDFRIPTPEIVNIAPDVDKWHVSNGAFINALTEIKNRNPSDQELDLHVPFKAAIWGWNNVGPEAQHPVWLALRQVDQRVFGTWKSKAQRIALMYVCQTLMQYRENPTPDNLARVPEFLRPRPSQEKIQHPAVIDFLIWPALRDRLVFEYQKYTSTGAFSKAFVENFNFYWPYPDRDIFVYDPANDGYEISPMFLRHAYEIRNWTMKPAFFKQFPEMQHDIPLFPGSSDGDVSGGDTWAI
ncbi:hypothetical protein LTS17_008173 [Exophiala oligosperma]